MKRRHRLFACLVAVAACTPAAPDPAARESELIVRTLAAAWERADSAMIAEIFWPQATYDDFPNQITYTGVEEILGYVSSLHGWADDVFLNVGRVHAGETGATAEWVLSAVQNRPLGDALPLATGREVLLNGVTIVEIEDGRILRAADYTDSTPLWLQLGGRLELPGGTVLGLDEPPSTPRN